MDTRITRNRSIVQREDEMAIEREPVAQTTREKEREREIVCVARDGAVDGKRKKKRGEDERHVCQACG